MIAPRIGFWPSIPPSAHLRRPARTMPFPLEDPDCRLFELARHGLWHGLGAHRLGAGDEVLVPAYHHGSEVEVMIEAGISCQYYEATRDLRPDEAELDRLVGPSVRALYLIHYLGFPQDAARWRRWCDERGLLLIEDVAMAWPARDADGPLGRLADLAIFSPWKAVGLRDTGAVVIRNAPPPPAPPTRHFAVRSLLRSHAAWLTRRLPRPIRDQPARPFDPSSNGIGNPGTGPSASSLRLLPRLWRERIAERRRENYAWLLERIGDRVPDPFRTVPAGSFPFAFPIVAPARDATVAGLRRQGIDACALWAAPHPALPVDRFTLAAERRSSGVLLPVHQDLGRRDLDRLARAVETASHAPAETSQRGPLEGERAPGFALADASGRVVELESLRGRFVVLVFYPHAGTPGCTKQACGLRNRLGELEALGAAVLGISPDGEHELAEFAGVHALGYTLLSDRDREVAGRYGAVWSEGRRGRRRTHTERATFVIDPDGIVRRVMRGIDVRYHDEQVANALLELARQPAAA